MAIASADGSARELPSQRRCLPGRLVRSYLARARGGAELTLRTRRVLAFAGEHVLGIARNQMANSFGVSESAISRDLATVAVDLRDVATDENLSLDAIFHRPEDLMDGAGI